MSVATDPNTSHRTRLPGCLPPAHWSVTSGIPLLPTAGRTQTPLSPTSRAFSRPV